MIEFYMANKNHVLEEYLRSGTGFQLIFVSVMVLLGNKWHTQMGWLRRVTIYKGLGRNKGNQGEMGCFISQRGEGGHATISPNTSVNSGWLWVIEFWLSFFPFKKNIFLSFQKCSKMSTALITIQSNWDAYQRDLNIG